MHLLPLVFDGTIPTLIHRSSCMGFPQTNTVGMLPLFHLELYGAPRGTAHPRYCGRPLLPFSQLQSTRQSELNAPSVREAQNGFGGSQLWPHLMLCNKSRIYGSLLKPDLVGLFVRLCPIHTTPLNVGSPIQLLQVMQMPPVPLPTPLVNPLFSRQVVSMVHWSHYRPL